MEAEQPSPSQIEAAVTAFAMLAEPTRLRLLWALAHGDHDVGELARAAGTAPAAASQHLAKLRLAGLVAARRQGRRQVYFARSGHVRTLIQEALHHADHQVAGHADHE